MDNTKEQRGNYYQNHRKQCKDAASKYYHRYYHRIKTEILGYYSNNTFQCTLCGSNQKIGIDHIGGGGTQHRSQLRLNSSMQFYLWLRKNNYPCGYRVLCRSCNSKNQPPYPRKGVSPSRLVLNYFRAENKHYSFKEIVTDLTPYATSERAVVMAILRLYKKGKLTRIKRGVYKQIIPKPGVITEPKHSTGYKTQEVADILNCSKYLLYSLEKRGLIPMPEQRSSGYRDYNKEDVLQLIQFMKTYVKYFP